MARRHSPDQPPGARLARSYLTVRAEQGAEQQPRAQEGLADTVRLPRLDQTQLNSPEAHAQFRLAMLARGATSGGPWFLLAQARQSR